MLSVARIRKAVAAKIDRYKRVFQLFCGLVLAGIILFGPPIFEEWRAEGEADVEAGAVSSGKTTEGTQ